MARTWEAGAGEVPELEPVPTPLRRWVGGLSARHLFVAVLALQAVLVLVVPGADLFGDESRYIKFAENLTNGSYTSAENPDLTNGPGYPLVLAPFVGIGAPTVAMRLLNAVFLAAAAAIMFRLLLEVASRPAALLGALALGLYPPSLYWGTFLYSEALSVFVMTAFLFLLMRVMEPRSSAWRIMAAAAALALLALTKTIFGVVTTGMALVAIGAFVVTRREPARRAALVFGGALLLCVPYLAYTFSLTGNVYQWSTNGGELLYWMASPFDNEVGSWVSPADVEAYVGLNEFHRSFHAEVAGLPVIDRDDAFREQGLEFIADNPWGYLGNLGPNLTRLLINVPYTGEQPSLGTLGYVVPNLLLLGATAVAVRRVWRRGAPIPPGLAYIVLSFLVFFVLSVLVPSTARYLIVVVPTVILFIAMVLSPRPERLLPEARIS